MPVPLEQSWTARKNDDLPALDSLEQAIGTGSSASVHSSVAANDIAGPVALAVIFSFYDRSLSSHH